jgi:hypothetical protein
MLEERNTVIGQSRSPGKKEERLSLVSGGEYGKP